jgi:hypothetical protein
MTLNDKIPKLRSNLDLDLHLNGLYTLRNKILSHSLSKAEFNVTTKEFKYEVNNPFIDKIDKLINDRIEQIVKFYE